MSAPKQKRLNSFYQWLTKAGAQVLIKTNEWELARFKTGNGTSVIYTSSRGGMTFIGEAKEAWIAFENNLAWKGAAPTKRRSKNSVIVRTLRQRDGDLCFFCQAEVQGSDESVEHLVPVNAGGPNHITNYFLTHRKCNEDAGCKSAQEKIKLHVAAVLTRQCEAIK